jgi:hypothetical protein
MLTITNKEKENEAKFHTNVLREENKNMFFPTYNITKFYIFVFFSEEGTLVCTHKSQG